MNLFFIRHAQSVNNALAAHDEPIQDRSQDPELTDLGYQQAEHLAEFLQKGHPDGGGFKEDSSGLGFNLTHLYASLMVRSVTTGAILAEHLDMPLIAWQDIHERGGIFVEDQSTGELVGRPGKDRAYFETRFPQLQLPSEMEAGGWWGNRPFEGPEQWPSRARRFMRDLHAKHGNTTDRVAVISHGGFYNDFLRVLIGLSPELGIWFEMFNAAITRIDFPDDGPRVIYHNRVDYLPPDLVS